MAKKEESVKEPIKQMPTFELNQGFYQSVSIKPCVAVQATRANGTVESPSSSC